MNHGSAPGRDPRATPPESRAPWAPKPRELWNLVNRPRRVERRAIRLASAALLIAYTLISLFPETGPRADFPGLRLTVCLYTLPAILFAHRFTWSWTRAYAVGTALLLSLSSGYIVYVGHGVAALPLLALATFAPLVFIQTARDLVLTDLVLIIGHEILLRLAAPPDLPLTTARTLIYGTLAGGTTAGMVGIFYRTAMDQSITWWQEVGARERVLREFAELAASDLHSDTLLEKLAARFRESLGEGCCSIILSEPGESALCVAVTAGAAAPRDFPLPEPLAAPARQVVLDRRPVVQAQLTEDEGAPLAEGLRLPFTPRCLVALPLTVEEIIAGVVALTAPRPRPISPELVNLWQAAANQTGVALAKARLFERLQRALQAKNEFLNTMSHELRSPLHVIVGFTDMLREGDVESDRHYLMDRIRRSAKELLELIENTLSVARLDAGKTTLRLEEFDPQEAINEVVQSVLALPEAKADVRLRWNVAPGLPLVRLDRLKVKQIVQNLVSNGLKFTHEGVVSVAVDQLADQLRIVVHDTGVGIPEDARQRIFNVFERVEHEGWAGRASPTGIGLGLYIVKSFVHLMGGSIEVTSHRGAGSCFTVLLPLHCDPAVIENGEAPEAAPTPPPARLPDPH